MILEYALTGTMQLRHDLKKGKIVLVLTPASAIAYTCVLVLTPDYFLHVHSFTSFISYYIHIISHYSTCSLKPLNNSSTCSSWKFLTRPTLTSMIHSWDVPAPGRWWCEQTVSRSSRREVVVRTSPDWRSMASDERSWFGRGSSWYS